MATLTLSTHPQPGAPPRRDHGSIAEDTVPEVALTWHEQVASAFRASRSLSRKSPRRSRSRESSLAGTR